MITVITSALNCKLALQLTAKSVLEQSVPLQWIVADGFSVDGTREYLASLNDPRLTWFSERDRGIYDAWNRACRHIQGDWVVFLGAGDTFVSSDSLSVVLNHLGAAEKNVLFAYGNVAQVHEGQILHRYGQVDLTGWQLGRPALPAHQGIFHRSSLLSVSDPFDVSYRIAGDTKFLTSSLKPTNTVYLSVDITHMDPNGVSSNRANAFTIMKESLRVEREVGYALPWGNRLLFVIICLIRVVLHHIGAITTWRLAK